MIQIATPIMSTRSYGTRYTAQGLGDRIHLITLAHQCSIFMNDNVELHLCLNHLGRSKRESFEEIRKIFSNDKIKIVYHEKEFRDDSSWIAYLRNYGVKVSEISYPDHPGWLESNDGLNIPLMLKTRALISPHCHVHQISIEGKYIVSQWDGSGPSRKIQITLIERILTEYNKLGFINVIVGGESLNPNLKDCLACIGAAIKNSECFVGIDSGFMHFALQILPYKKIHIYNSYRNYWSHHLLRARDTGVQINPFIISNNLIFRLYVKYRFDSPFIAKIVHLMKGTKKLQNSN